MIPVAGDVAAIEASLSPAQKWGAPRDDGKRRHAGIDLAAKPGAPVLAPEAGRIEVVAEGGPGAAMPRPWSRYGPAIVMLHGASRAWHLLAHVRRPLVRQGEFVKQGQPLAEVSELHHVHWEIRRFRHAPPGETAFSNSVNPVVWEINHGEASPLSEGAEAPRKDPCHG